jgi:predicted  nucleic acid-binding Zn-ribbon protein
MSLNSILKKISQSDKIELAKHKVELGVITDIEQSVSKANSELGKIKGAYLDLKDKLSNLKKESVTLNKIKEDITKNKSKAEAQAKDLGVDISGMRQISDADFYKSEIDDFLKLISNSFLK